MIRIAASAPLDDNELIQTIDGSDPYDRENFSDLYKDIFDKIMRLQQFVYAIDEDNVVGQLLAEKYNVVVLGQKQEPEFPRFARVFRK